MRASCGHELTAFDGPTWQGGQGWSLVTEQVQNNGHTIVRAGTYCNSCKAQMDGEENSRHELDAHDWWEEEAA